LIGDFNSNKIWDTKDIIANHTDVVEFLKLFDIESVYHRQFNEEQGKETQNTFFMNRKFEKPYHIDYVFASNRVTKMGFKLSLESWDNWREKSDHVPLIFDINSFDTSLNFNNTYQDALIRQFKNLSKSTKEKFGKEINELKIKAALLDNDKHSIEKQLEFINDIDLIKQIDKLAVGLKINS